MRRIHRKRRSGSMANDASLMRAPQVRFRFGPSGLAKQHFPIGTFEKKPIERVHARFILDDKRRMVLVFSGRNVRVNSAIQRGDGGSSQSECFVAKWLG